MAALLTTAATMLCPHGGTITGTIAAAKRVSAGAPVLTVSDTFLIAGCPFMIGTVAHPCVTVKWIAPALHGTADHGALLTTDSQGLCQAADQAPQGPPNLIAAQMKASAT